jgi:hypothetical protein
VLVGHIEKGRSILTRIGEKYDAFLKTDFKLEYDWDKLSYLEKKFAEIRPRIQRELAVFEDFLRDLQK